MILSLNINPVYLLAPRSRSRVELYHYMGKKDGKQFNDFVYTLARIIEPVMGSAAEAKGRELYTNRQEWVTMRVFLEELNHPQSPTSIRNDNITIDGIINIIMELKI